jgi:serine/threonine protein phosphatase PrpC
MQIQFWAATDVGLTRNHNEDNFLVDRKLNLFIVADGMGGHAAGEIASSVAVHEVRKVLMESREVIDRYASSGSVLRRQPVLSLIDRAISQACQLVYRLAQEDSERHGMGTTLSMLLIINGRGFVGHVGDSRIYMTRGAEAKLVTEDHSVINELIKSGRLNPEEAHNSPYKNAVTRAVGVHEAVEVDTFDFEVKPGDNYLLCSDGLSGYFERDEEIKPYLADEDIKQIPQRLIDYANHCGGKDNITAIIVRMSGEQAKSSLFNPPSSVTSSTGGFSTDSGAGTIPPHLDLTAIEGVDDSLSDELVMQAKEGMKGLAPAPPPLAPASSKALSQLPLDMLKLTPLFAFFDLNALEELAHHLSCLSSAPSRWSRSRVRVMSSSSSS